MNIIHLISNKEWGGGERYALDLCKALRADGHTVWAIVRNKTAVLEPFAREGLAGATMSLRGLAAMTTTPVRLASFINRLDGDVTVHVHNFKDAATALNARRLAKDPGRVRVVATRHLVKPAKTTASQLRIYNSLDAIIFVSQLARDKFMSTNPPIDSGRMHVVHNSAAMEPYEGDKPQGKQANIIFTGRIAKEKGLDVLINALGQLKDLDWRLTVCGTGKGQVVMPIVRAARSLEINDRIEWKGHVDDVAAHLREAHIAVMPSVWAEPFGLSAIEAMSQGCAVITTDNGAQTEFLADGATALLTAPGDIAGLAAALRRLIEDRPLRDEIARKGREEFEKNLSYSNFYRKTLAILKGKGA